MFQPSIFPLDQKPELQLAYDGNPESIGQKIYFHPPTGALVYSYVANQPNGGEALVLADTGMTMENVIQDFSAAGQGTSPLQTMWQFATQETAEKVCRIIEEECALPFPVKAEVYNKPPNAIFPHNKPMRAIKVTRTDIDNGKVADLNAGLEAQAFGSTLLVPEFKNGEYSVRYAPAPKLEMLRNNLVEALQ